MSKEEPSRQTTRMWNPLQSSSQELQGGSAGALQQHQQQQQSDAAQRRDSDIQSQLLELQQQQQQSLFLQLPQHFQSDPSSMLQGAQLAEAEPKVKVKCESCGVLLEVCVPRNHFSSTMIVKCGNCESILEVVLGPLQLQSNPSLFLHQQQHQLGLGLGLGHPSPSFGLQGSLDGMSALQQQQQQAFQNPPGSGGHPMPGLASQYNMLHHQGIFFESLGHHPTSLEDQARREHSLRALATMTGVRNAGMIRNAGMAAMNGGEYGAYPLSMGMGMEDPNLHVYHQGPGRKRKQERDPNKPKKLSKYNEFVKMEVARLKESDKSLSHKDMFKMAALRWRTSPMNPKNAAMALGSQGPKLFTLSFDTDSASSPGAAGPEKPPLIKVNLRFLEEEEAATTAKGSGEGVAGGEKTVEGPATTASTAAGTETTLNPSAKAGTGEAPPPALEQDLVKTELKAELAVEALPNGL